MFGIVLIVMLLVIGVYLLADALVHRVRCTEPVQATAELAASQTELAGKSRRSKFPDYHFHFNGVECHVRDYNAGKAAPASGETLLLYCDPAHPEKLWYAAGKLWQDFFFGAAALAGAAVLAALYLL